MKRWIAVLLLPYFVSIDNGNYRVMNGTSTVASFQSEEVAEDYAKSLNDANEWRTNREESDNNTEVLESSGPYYIPLYEVPTLKERQIDQYHDDENRKPMKIYDASHQDDIGKPIQ